MTRVGDAANDHIRRACFDGWRGALAEHHGSEVKTQGDGLMACFASAVDAVECGAALQTATARLDGESPDLGLALRVGISSGEASFDDGDWFGTPVVEAARLCAAAEPGQILAAEIVATLARTRSDRAFHDAGAYTLKGLPAPLSAVSVSWERPHPAPRVPLPRPLCRPDSVFAFFVGRHDELERLVRGWKQVAAGERRCFLVAGEPGIGKTTLVAEAARLAYDDGATVLYGRCDQELSAPFQPFAEALRGLLTAADARLLEQVRPHLDEVSRLVPAVRDLVADLPAPAAGDPEVERQLLFEAVVAVLTQVGPAVLVLDDLHWATKPTLLLLRHLLLSPSADPLLVLATYRDTDLSRTHPLSAMLADLRRAGAARRIVLRGLSRDDGTAFVEAAAGHDLEQSQQRLAETMHDVTEGHPLFLREVLSHLVESGVIYQREGRWVTDIDEVDFDRLGLPEGVRDAISRRLSALSNRANEVLRAAAVIGPTFELRVLDRIPDLAGDGVVDALDEVLATGLIAEGDWPGSYQFVHALVRQTLLDELTSTRRMRLHRRVAEGMEALHDAGERVDALAHHYAEAALDGGAEKAADYAIAAARLALDRVAQEEAVGHAERALEVLDFAGVDDIARRIDLQIILGRASRDFAVARSALLKAAELARGVGDRRRVAEAAISLDTLTLLGQEEPRTEALLIEALETAEDEILRCIVMACLAEYRFRAGAGEGADLAEEALRLARQLGDDASLVVALTAQLTVLTGSHDLATRLRLREELIAALERVPRDEQLRAVRVRQGGYNEQISIRGTLWLQAGDRDRYDQHVDSYLASSVARMFRGGDLTRAFIALMEGRLDEAEAMITVGLDDHNQRIGQLNNFLAQFMLLRREQGRWEEIYGALVASADANPTLVAFEAGVAMAEAEMGRTDEAAVRLRSLVHEDLARVPRDSLFPSALSFLTIAAFALRDADSAGVLLPHVELYRGQVLVVSGVVAALGSADRFEAMCLATLGRYEEADVRFESARGIERRIRSEPFVARTDVAHAEMLLRRGTCADQERARSLLAGAEEAAARLGMDGVRRQAAALLAGAGI